MLRAHRSRGLRTCVYSVTALYRNRRSTRFDFWLKIYEKESFMVDLVHLEAQDGDVVLPPVGGFIPGEEFMEEVPTLIFAEPEEGYVTIMLDTEEGHNVSIHHSQIDDVIAALETMKEQF